MGVQHIEIFSVLQSLQPNYTSNRLKRASHIRTVYRVHYCVVGGVISKANDCFVVHSAIDLASDDRCEVIGDGNGSVGDVFQDLVELSDGQCVVGSGWDC
ncbi:unnamed protein product [Adineta ricciae]|uniref:Uncharacterized protein n=1 Tax=Adineta ricciae TaxID=249248 RepID=A0A813YR53_ADIRI|nr:unnamed protein product [Adineta ricciae]